MLQVIQHIRETESSEQRACDFFFVAQTHLFLIPSSGIWNLLSPAASPIQEEQQLLQQFKATSGSAHLTSFSFGFFTAHRHETFPNPVAGNLSDVASPLQSEGHNTLGAGDIVVLTGAADGGLQQLWQQFSATSGIAHLSSLRSRSLKAHLHDRSPSPAIVNFCSVVSPVQSGLHFGEVGTEDSVGTSDKVLLGVELGSLDGANVCFTLMLGAMLGIVLGSDEGLDVFW